MLNLPGLVGFTAAFRFRATVTSHLGLSEKQRPVPVEASHGSGAGLPRERTWDLPRWGTQGQVLGRAQAGELCRKNPNVSPKPHFVLKKEECSRKKKKKKGRILISSSQSLVILGNTLF